MILSVRFEDGSQLYEEVRSACIENGKLIYYSKAYRPAESRVLDIDTIAHTAIISDGTVFHFNLEGEIHPIIG